MTGVEMLQGALREAMLSKEKEFGEIAGSEVMEYGHSRGLNSDTHSPYQSVCHHAALADILSVAIRKPTEGPWSVPETLVTESYQWNSGALISPCGSFLRRFVLVSSWSSERENSEIHSWKTAGEIAAYKMPMQLIVANIGPHRDGKRHSYFTKGLVHPRSGRLRFKKKSQTTSSEFRESWSRIWRDDMDQFTTQQWLDAMVQDDVLSESLFVIEVPVPRESEIGRIRDLAAKKLEVIQSWTETPGQNLTTCFWPNPCPFLGVCKGNKWTEPSVKAGFLPLQQLALRGN